MKFVAEPSTRPEDLCRMWGVWDYSGPDFSVRGLVEGSRCKSFKAAAVLAERMNAGDGDV